MINKKFINYSSCKLCPRMCNVDRTKTTGFCRESSSLSIHSALMHFGEEPCISFKKGSGTIFFTGCSLRCSFCQNMQISQDPVKKKYYTMEEFIKIIMNLIKKGVENINFITPDHFMPHIIEAIKYLKSNGIIIPIIYNCSGYQSIEHLKEIDPYIDIYLFDYKFADKDAAVYCIATENYPEVSLKALDFILNSKGSLVLDDNGKAIKGVLIRHLVMPGFIDNSIKLINNIYFNHGNRVYLSLMSQYTSLYLRQGNEIINRRLYKGEYDEVLFLIKNLGFDNVYTQDFLSENDEYIPDFNDKKMFDNW